MSRTRASCDRGFTLLEVLMAFAILAIALVTLLQALTAGMNSTRHSEAHTYATLLAESRLAAAGVEAALDAGPREGTSPGGFRWRTEAEPLAADGDLVPHVVTAHVSWGKPPRERSVSLRTIRLAELP